MGGGGKKKGLMGERERRVWGEHKNVDTFIKINLSTKEEDRRRRQRLDLCLDLWKDSRREETLGLMTSTYYLYRGLSHLQSDDLWKRGECVAGVRAQLSVGSGGASCHPQGRTQQPQRLSLQDEGRWNRSTPNG